MTDAQWSRVLDVTLTGTFRCTRAALKHMIPRGRGVIVNNASVLGVARAGRAGALRGGEGGGDGAHAVRGDRGGGAGVRMNAVAPSLAMHPFLAKVTTAETLRELAGARGVRARRRAVGGGERDRVPGERLLDVHDRARSWR